MEQLSALLYSWEFCPDEMTPKEHAQLAKLLRKLGVLKRRETPEDNKMQVVIFAAALEYCGDAEKAANITRVGNFEFFHGIETDAELGAKILEKNDMSLVYPFDAYFDYEQLGDDYAYEHKGEFTRYGYFAER